MAEYCGCELPEDLWYDLDYLWARPNDDGTFTLGLTDPAQTMAGRVVAATFRKAGTHRAAGKNLATLESGKWVGGVPAPFDGTDPKPGRNGRQNGNDGIPASTTARCH